MNEERARQGVEHLQSAAFEIIHAFRAFLDVVEDLVRDPASVAGLATSIVETARPATAEPEHDEARVTRIRVS